MNGSTRPKIPRRVLDGVLLLDKPLGLSSNDALIRAKRIYLAKKAGHTGTLDPLATGLLPLCFGEATKFSQDLLEADKTYEATMRLGVRTTTGDAEGEVTGDFGGAVRGDVGLFHGARADRSVTARSVNLDELRGAIGHHRECQLAAAGDIQIHHAAIISADRVSSCERLVD